MYGSMTEVNWYHYLPRSANHYSLGLGSSTTCHLLSDTDKARGVHWENTLTIIRRKTAEERTVAQDILYKREISESIGGEQTHLLTQIAHPSSS